jgi:hypothetical protein
MSAFRPEPLSFSAHQCVAVPGHRRARTGRHLCQAGSMGCCLYRGWLSGWCRSRSRRRLTGSGVERQDGEEGDDHQAHVLAQSGGRLAHPESAEVAVPPQAGRNRSIGIGYGGGRRRHTDLLGDRRRVPPISAPRGCRPFRQQEGKARCAAYQGQHAMTGRSRPPTSTRAPTTGHVFAPRGSFGARAVAHGRQGTKDGRGVGGRRRSARVHGPGRRSAHPGMWCPSGEGEPTAHRATPRPTAGTTRRPALCTTCWNRANVTPMPGFES